MTLVRPDFCYNRKSNMWRLSLGMYPRPLEGGVAGKNIVIALPSIEHSLFRYRPPFLVVGHDDIEFFLRLRKSVLWNCHICSSITILCASKYMSRARTRTTGLLLNLVFQQTTTPSNIGPQRIRSIRTEVDTEGRCLFELKASNPAWSSLPASSKIKKTVSWSRVCRAKYIGNELLPRSIIGYFHWSHALNTFRV